jgi:hypothetical protein
MRTNVILYPIFLKCCAYLTDPFWIYLFEDLAYEKCPYGIIIRDDCLYSIQKNKEFTYHFANKDPKIIVNELFHIFSKKLHILSEKDHIFKRKFCQSYYEDMIQNISCWNEIKKKK